MCTVTVIPRATGYCLAMNRDEKLTRIAGLPPARREVAGHVVLCPSEPGGGTWIALNDSGSTLTLINWYSIKARVKRHPASRGLVVNAAATASDPITVAAALAGLPLKRINAFRLIGVFPASREIAEWRWDLKRLIRKNHRWKSQQWISSGYDEPAAQRVRSQTFRCAMQQSSAGSLDWLRRLHRSHAPQSGPFATCMHRTDAATVSYTEITVSRHDGAMQYHAGTPCRATQRPSVNKIRLNHPVEQFASPRTRDLTGKP